MILEKLARHKRVESYVVTAIPHGSRVYVGFNVVDADGDFIGSAVIYFERESLDSKLLFESKQPLIDYVIDKAGWQCLMLQGRVVEIEGDGKPKETTKQVPEGLYRISALGDRRAAICGDDGQVVIYSKGKFGKVAVDTGAENAKYAEDLRSIHFATPTRGYAVGDYGAFLKGDTKKLAPAWGKANPFEIGHNRRNPVFSVYETASGAVLLGSDAGTACVFEKGKFTKLAGLARDARVFAMVEFAGLELWSSDDNSALYERKGSKLSKRPEEAGGYRMEANGEVMASSCGSFVYLFDGETWTRLRINPNPKKLVEKLKLDFRPAKATKAKKVAKPAKATKARKVAKPAKARYFELVSGSSKKFWAISIAGTSVKTRYGRIGSAGSQTDKPFGDAASASNAYDQLVAEKTKKGYLERDNGAD